MELILILNDQGGGEVVRVTKEHTHALRANAGGHLPIILLTGDSEWKKSFALRETDLAHHIEEMDGQ